MSIKTQITLALMDAEDGEFERADAQLGALVVAADEQLRTDPDNGSAIYDLANCLLSRANVRQSASRLLEALEDVERAEPMIARLKPLGQHVLKVEALQVRIRLHGNGQSSLYDLARAEHSLAQLRSLTQDGPNPWIADLAELGLAQKLGEPARVAPLALGCIPILEQRGQVRGAQALGLTAANALLTLDKPSEAEPLAQQAYAFFMKEGPSDLEAGAALALARASGTAADWPLAEHGLKIVEQLTRTQPSLFDQQRYLSEKIPLFEGAIRFALNLAAKASGLHDQADHIVKAWQVVERTKSFSLRQGMVHGGWLREIDPDTAFELERLDAQLVALEKVEKPERQSKTAAEKRALLFGQRQDMLQSAMRKSPRMAATVSPPAFKIDQVLAAAPDGVALLSWYWLQHDEEWDLHSFYAGADRIAQHSVCRWTADEVAGLKAARVSSATADPQWVKQMLGPDLGQKLFPAKVLDAMAGCHTVLITPHGHLQQLPVHAAQLPNADGAPTWLFEHFAVLLLPTMALPPPDRTARKVQRNILLLGSEQDGFNHEKLEQVPPELRSVAAIWQSGGHQVVSHHLSEQHGFSDVAALTHWCDFDLIHLACHGDFKPESPLDATLYLGSEPLRGSDLMKIELRSDVVCLSACNMAQLSSNVDGVALAADEWLGFALPLFQAGNRSILSSLWEANSQISKLFMEDFHSALAQGHSPAQAHRLASIKQSEKPYGLWANWQISGYPD